MASVLQGFPWACSEQTIPSTRRSSRWYDGLAEIPVDGDIAIRANELTGLHADPADRLIVATALGGHRLVTADKRILSWSGRLSRVDARQ